MSEWEMWKDALRVFFETRNDTMCFVIVCFGIGAIAAAFAAFAEKNGVGRLVRYLLQSGATDPDSAQTLKSAGLAGSPLCRFALRRRSPLWYVVSSVACTGEGNCLANRQLYIPPEHVQRAQHAYRGKGSGLGAVLLTIVLVLLFVALLLFIEPYLVQYGKDVFEALQSR